MHAANFQDLLVEFAKQARKGIFLTGDPKSSTEADELAALSENLSARIQKAISSGLVTINPITFGPGKCPTCGK